MRKRLLPILILACVLLSVAELPVRAASMICFTGANDTLLPLTEDTMPAYYGTTLYVPGSVFQYLGLYTGFETSQGRYYVYKGLRRLDFFIQRGTVSDADGVEYKNVPAHTVNDSIYLPLDLLCEYFGMTYAVISVPANLPLSVLRIKSADAVFND
ncbi:MAG: hypothetical protein LBT36_01535, partial [Oscillospiraceae bacterium]|nr:hypothetical protein [Oscillospiraceae bacterium]